jgi:hypothetical protein
MEEVWKKIVGYEHLYKVSNTGKVISFQPRWKKPREIKLCTDGGGYQILTLVKDKNKSTRTVHRLVAEAFLGHSTKDINHKDGNKKNNNLPNLEYCSKSENSKHAIKNGFFKPNFENIAIKKRKPIMQVDVESGETINVFVSAHEASRKTGFNRGNISYCCRTGNKTCGFYWRFV